MKRVFFIAITAIAIMAFSCTPAKQEQSTAETTEKSEPVRTITLDYQTISRTVDYTATLQAYEEIHLAPSTPGRIENIYVEVGTRVAKGDALVQMDRTQLHQAEVQLATLEADFKRFDTLQKVGSIPQQQYDQLQAQVDIARNNIAFLRDNTRLIAPFSGVISGKYYEPGEMFSGAPNPMVGKAAIVSLLQIDRLKAIVSVSERFFPLLKAGLEIKVMTDIYPDKDFKGRVFRIHPTIDPASRTFNVEVAIDNYESLLRPGMYCRVSLDLDQFQAMVVPAIAVLKMQGSNDRYMFIEEGGKAKRVAVTIGKRYDDQVEVISDVLKQGDQIVVSGQARLLDGMKVEVVKPE
ncbi:MAG: efflux RND transporter periplasmic adaptor subunit [Bacteroidales bacterium]|nr:efflux RND transporter periplasmic adaptor subunit [Bacteroidales bacterium]